MARSPSIGERQVCAPLSRHAVVQNPAHGLRSSSAIGREASLLMRDLNEGPKIAYEIVPDKRSCKSSAESLKPA